MVVRERVKSKTWRSSVREPVTNEKYAPNGKSLKMVPVIIANKPHYRWTIYVLRVLKTNLLHIQVEKLWE